MTVSSSRSFIPVFLFVPNLLGYLRIGLALYGMCLCDDHPIRTIQVFLLSASLDLVDGLLARALDQTSALGVLVDIAADNTLRTCGWLAAASRASPLVKTAAALFISVEWMTMVATQLHSAVHGQHWKQSRANDPWLVRALFANNFRNPIGMLSMFGLFSSSLWTYGAYHPELYDAIPYFDILRNVAYLGRALSLAVELWMIHNYLSLVIAKDTKDQKRS
jgi:CDP-diacylglycerol--inositol 3-phosphatidyltransferase